MCSFKVNCETLHRSNKQVNHMNSITDASRYFITLITTVPVIQDCYKADLLIDLYTLKQYTSDRASWPFDLIK